MFSFNRLESLDEDKNKNEKIPVTKVVIELFRHSLKENDPSRSNSELLLTLEGRELARAKGESLSPSPKRAVAGASLMDRAAETAMLFMLSDEETIETDDSLKEMEDKVSQELPVGKKLYRDERLGFSLDKGTAGETGRKAYKAGNYLEWITKDSDEQVIENKDLKTSSYLRQAGNIAELLERYQKIGNNFNHLVSDKNKEEDHGLKLERYLASHQGVAESFVAKVLEIQEGLSARDEFASSLGNGWKETQGIHVEITNNEQGQRSFISFNDAQGNKKEILLDSDTLVQIIKERKDLEKACQAE